MPAVRHAPRWRLEGDAYTLIGGQWANRKLHMLDDDDDDDNVRMIAIACVRVAE